MRNWDYSQVFQLPGIQAMLTQQPLTLALAATFFLSGSHGQALEESTTLPFALTVGKALVTAPKPFIEVSSTKRVYISEGHALALADTQCLYTEIPSVQLCFGHRWPTRVRLLPHKHLKIGLHSLGLSQLAYRCNPLFVTETLQPVANENVPSSSPRRWGSTAVVDSRLRGNDGCGIFRSATILNPVARAIITEILQGVAEQDDIIEQARQRSLMFLHLNHRNSDIPEPLGESGAPEESAPEESAPEESAEEEGEPIEWWGVTQQPASDTDDSPMARVRFDHNVLLKPGTRYCFVPGNETRAYRQAAPGDEPGSEDNSTSDESRDDDPDEEDIEIDSDVEFIGTTPDPFPVSKEVRDYCAGLAQIKIKQEPTSDSEMPTESEIATTDSTLKTPLILSPLATRKKSGRSGEKPYLCQVCGKTFAQSTHLTKHRRTHSGEKPYLCQLCGKTFAQNIHLTKHLRTHSGEKPYPCQVCGKAFSDSSSLVRHRRTHSGERPYPCQVCGKAFSDSSSLARHRRTHSGERPYPCQVCGKVFARYNTLKIHQRTHSGEKPYPCEQCGKRFAQRSHLKLHRCTTEESPTQRK